MSGHLETLIPINTIFYLDVHISTFPHTISALARQRHINMISSLSRGTYWDPIYRKRRGRWGKGGRRWEEKEEDDEEWQKRKNPNH